MAKDVYKYFRIEARDLCERIGSGILALDKPYEEELVARLLRYAHTLKGAARVVKQLEIARCAHGLEEILLAKRDARASATPEEIQALLALIDQIGAQVATLSGETESEPPPASSPPAEAPASQPPRAPAPARALPAEQVASLRMDVEQLDSLVHAANAASQSVAALRRELSGLDRIGELAGLLRDALAPRATTSGVNAAALHRMRGLGIELVSELERLRRDLSGAATNADAEAAAVAEAAHQLRLLPASTLFPVLERAVYDAAIQLDKRVELRASGGEVRLDAHVLGSLRDALLHVVRNAVAHGIETLSERRAAGKPEQGSVTLSIARRGSRVVFCCHDDGRGIDLTAVRRVAVQRGLVALEEAAQLDARRLTDLLLRSGLSTSREVTQISGHGIGLDVVNETVTRLKGVVAIESTPAVGTRIELDVPISVAALPALWVQVRGGRVALPLDTVVAAARIPANDITRAHNRETLARDGKVIPFLPLERALDRGAKSGASPSAWSVVILRSGERSAAFGVERVLGTRHVVMRSLPPLVQADNVVAGAALDAEGNPELVLDAAALVELASASEAPAEARKAPVLPPILVIDDSLTTRMLEQSILQSAGYRVDLAVSAEDGLEKARAKHYGLFIVDVEMPGMNGFEFVATTRADPELKSVPAILVTSRDAPEDKLRGQRAGASAYVVKGEFEQGHLLRTIRSLMG
ncbi:MAG: hybrid sensor histidine kinase/response regulator [Myxococcota bacterium]